LVFNRCIFYRIKKVVGVFVAFRAPLHRQHPLQQHATALQQPLARRNLGHQVSWVSGSSAPLQQHATALRAINAPQP
jgi:hypothetical protein